MNGESMHPVLIDVNEMAQNSGLDDRQIGVGYHAGMLHGKRLRIAMRVYLEGCQADRKPVGCSNCSEFLIKLCEFNDGRIESDE